MIAKQIREDTRGSSLLEYTVTIPLFLSLMFGLVQAGLLLFTYLGLQHGVERAARCASVNYSAYQIGLSQSCFSEAPSTAATDTTAIKQYAAQSSWGSIVPALSSFTIHIPPGDASAKCGTGATAVPGYVVTVSQPYNLFKPLVSVTLTATSCFPINVS